MTPRTIRRLLFVVALFTLPLPFYLGDLEFSPAVRLLFLSTLFGAVAVAEGGGTISLLGALGVVQTLLALGLVWGLAAVVAGMLGRLRAPALRGALLASILLGLVVGSLFEIYATGLSSTRPRSNVLHLFE
ncbi:MAG: hypothetical protein ACQGVC_07570 [Myxococcota bacterium]